MEKQPTHGLWLSFILLQTCCWFGLIKSTSSISGLCKLSNLVYLDLSGNRLEGSIPLCLSNLPSIDSIALSQNQFDSVLFPRSTSGPSYLDISSNKTHGPSYLDISSNKIHGMLPNDISLFLPNLKYFNMSNNFLHGSIPSTLGDIKHIGTLDLSNNNLSGKIPYQLLSNAISLEYLDLSSNRLEGKMLSRRPNAPHMKILDIRNNSLSGILPTWFSSLRLLNLLIVKENHFEGQIPTELCQMKNLHILDLSHNRLIGRIPSCFDHITSWKEEIKTEIKIAAGLPSVEFTTKGITYSYKGIVLSLMTGIDLSSNKLTGCIPSQLGYLAKLHSLNMSHNNLVGPIPESFNNLEQIESLDLSFNQLNGTIPPTLNQLFHISSFSVAYNKLLGKTPDDKFQFATFNESSYVGNVGLCGKPLNRSCSSTSVAPKKEDGRESSSSITSDSFICYSIAAISYILGFWGVIFLLHCKKNLRIKYFEVVDVCIDYCLVRFQVLLLKICNFRYK